MNLNWSDHYSIGIPEIDIQNQRILIIINSLYHAENVNEEESLIHKLHSYLSRHFRFLEKLMAHYNYPEIELRKGSHRFYLYQISQYTLPLDEEYWNKNCFLNFMISWFTEHIMDECKQWGEYINSKQQGVKDGRGTNYQPVPDIQCG